MRFTLAHLSLCDAVEEGQVCTHQKPECIASPHQSDLVSHIHGGVSGWKLSLFISHHAQSCGKPCAPGYTLTEVQHQGVSCQVSEHVLLTLVLCFLLP